MLLQASAGADVQQAAVVEPAPVEETTELGLVLADILETMSAEQTVEAGHVERLRGGRAGAEHGGVPQQRRDEHPVHLQRRYMV